MKNVTNSAFLGHRILNSEQAHIEVHASAFGYVELLLENHESLPIEILGKENLAHTSVRGLIGSLMNEVIEWQRQENPICVVEKPKDAAHFVVAQNSPQGLLPGCVLQNFAHAANCHEAIAAHVHDVHLWHTGHFSRGNNHSALYRHLLELTNQYLPEIESPLFSERAGLLPSSWDLAAFRLALSLFPKKYAPEILGAALFELHMPVSPLVRGVLRASEVQRTHSYLDARHDTSKRVAERRLEHAIELLIAQSTTSQTGPAERVARGYLVSMRLLSAWHDEMSRYILERLLDPAAAMVDLIRRKSRFASGYHDRLKLAHRQFDEYVTQDPENFVRDLADSRWVVRGKPEESLLLTRLVAFGGPMFRVFSDQEIEVMRAWVASLDTKTNQAPRDDRGNAVLAVASGTAEMTEPVVVHEWTNISRERHTKDAKLCARELYHRLLNREDYPEVFNSAHVFAETWLARTAALPECRADAMPFATYTHALLRRWFDEKALGQAQSYAGTSKKIEKSREQVIDEAVQLCPMIFVDGGWLQRWANAGYVESDIGVLLYKIFSDEIGNGDTRLNHPNIYRDLMRQMGVDLPDFRTRQFAMNELFSDASFEVPAFWLSISQFPRRFLPETLGLNLAMELSGVGGAYRVARDELRHYKFNTIFVDLHNTIDNVSSGHSAMALQAIELHMDNIFSSGNQVLVETQWRRVWTGFCALAIPRRSWKEVFVKPTYAA